MYFGNKKKLQFSEFLVTQGSIPRCPSTEVQILHDCSKAFSTEHALSCAKGGFPTIRHNEIRDLTADLLTEVCNDVRIEPDLQPITEETLRGMLQLTLKKELV